MLMMRMNTVDSTLSGCYIPKWDITHFWKLHQEPRDFSHRASKLKQELRLEVDLCLENKNIVIKKS